MLTPHTDLNVAFGFWPFQRFMLRTPEALANHLRQLGIQRALVSAVESILFPDPDVYDAECFEQLRPHPELRPVKTVNPILPNWPDSLAAFDREYGLAGIKLFPSYHRYALSDPRVSDLLRAAADQQLPVLIPIRVEDERQHHHSTDFPPVEAEAIVELAAAHPDTTVVILNGYIGQAGVLAEAPPNLYMDFAMCERPDTLAGLLGKLPVSQLVFGSATPFLTTQAAIAKLRLGTIEDEQRRQIIANTAKLVP